MLLEPNRVLAKSYLTALKNAGHKVRHYARGQSAIEAADKRTPDLVIVELQVPGHNGLEFLYEFRSYAEWQNVPVVIQSIVPQDAIEQAAASPHFGISAYLYKPVTKLSKLTETVNELLQPVSA